MSELKIKEFKSGDRYFLVITNPIVITLVKYDNHYWTCQAPELGNMIYESELISNTIGENLLIKIENDKHLLQLKLKYS